MIYDSLEWWQILVPLVWVVMGVVGLSLLLRKPRWQPRDPAALAQRRRIGLALVIAAVVGYFATDSVTSPEAAPLPHRSSIHG